MISTLQQPVNTGTRFISMLMDHIAMTIVAIVFRPGNSGPSILFSTYIRKILFSHMKYLPCFFFFALAANQVCAQKNESLYLFKGDWSATQSNKEAVYFLHVVKENDSSYVCRYYTTVGPMVKMETYRDEALTMPGGRFAWYNRQGKLDSTGWVDHRGRKDGNWFYSNPDSAKVVVMMSQEFDHGKLLHRVDHLRGIIYYPDGRTSGLNNDDSLSERSEQVEAAFPGGLTAWRRYLERNLDIPARFRDIIGEGRATVETAFTVDTSGIVSDIFIFNSAEWSADMEALRLIRKSPRWVPASQNGKNVKFRQRQSITFVVFAE
ncbi:MAG TPA: energy transducer TonB [Chitinophagaceae bacterium]